MGDQDRPTFLPPEEPPEEPLEESPEPPEAPLSAPLAPPAPARDRHLGPRRRGRVIALVTVAVLVFAGGFIWANAPTRERRVAEPRAFARLTDVCMLVPSSSVQPLTPSAAGRPYFPPGGGTLRAEVFAACRWATGEGVRDGRGPHEQRRLNVNVRVALPREGTTGQEAARLLYTTGLTAAQDMAAKHIRLDSGITEYWAVRALPGVGDAAYGQYEISRSGTSVAGLGRVVVRLRNAIITVEYSGADYPADRNGFPDRAKATPLLNEPARRGAADIATRLTYALAACTTCVN